MDFLSVRSGRVARAGSATSWDLAHTATYGGNPVCCAAAAKVLEIIQRDRLCENAVVQGARLRDGLLGLKSPRIREVGEWV